MSQAVQPHIFGNQPIETLLDKKKEQAEAFLQERIGDAGEIDTDSVMDKFSLRALAFVFDDYSVSPAGDDDSYEVRVPFEGSKELLDYFPVSPRESIPVTRIEKDAVIISFSAQGGADAEGLTQASDVYSAFQKRASNIAQKVNQEVANFNVMLKNMIEKVCHDRMTHAHHAAERRTAAGVFQEMLQKKSKE